jgi:hypothetical protein
MIPNIKNLLAGAVIALLLLLETTSVFAQGGALMVNPKRIIFDGTKRNDVITLYNDGSDTTSYAITFKHYEMQQDGSFKDIDTIKTDELFCDDMVKYFPREVTLAPHSAQTVRLQLLKPQNLAPGEYRSHLYFRGIERAQALETPKTDTSKTITLNLKAVFGLAVPIIVRTGTTPSQVTLTNLTLSPADTARFATLTFDINRTGNESAYGEFKVSYFDAKFDKGVQAGEVKGVGVYVPLAMRRFDVRVKLPPVTSSSTGKLHVEYRTMTGEAKESVIATADLPMK